MRLSVLQVVRSIAVALLLLAATTVALIAVRDRLDTLSVALVYLTAVVVLALRGDTRSAAVGSIVAFLCFNFFFIAPYHTFEVAEPRNVLEELVLRIIWSPRSRGRVTLARWPRQEHIDIACLRHVLTQRCCSCLLGDLRLDDRHAGVVQPVRLRGMAL